MVTPRYVTLDSAKIKDRVIRNPNYGGPRLSYQGWCSQPVTPATRKVKFFEALRESIKREGFRNPIIVWNFREGLHVQFGVSRLRVAQEEGLFIKAIVNDTQDEYDECPLVTPENYETCFTDVPERVRFNNDGSFDYHYSLERNRRDTFDPAGMAWADPDADFITKEFSWIDKDAL